MSKNLDEVDSPHLTTQAALNSYKQVFAYLGVVAQAITQTFGSRCEVVVHDFTDPEHSIVSIAGNLTGRKVGGAITDLGLSVLESGSPNQAVLTYETRAPDGRRLKSTSALLRDQNGEIFGAFCINFDSEVISQAVDLLTELCQVPMTNEELEEHFSDDPVEIVTTIIQEELGRLGMNTGTGKLKREQRIEIVQALQERGVFNMRNAPTIIANQLGVSRFTIYNHLNEARSRKAGEEKMG